MNEWAQKLLSYKRGDKMKRGGLVTMPFFGGVLACFASPIYCLQRGQLIISRAAVRASAFSVSDVELH